MFNPVKGDTEDFGALTRSPCPQCECERWFHLKRHSTSARILGVSFAGSRSFSLHCETCEYPIDITLKDGKDALEFLPIAQRFNAGEISEEELADEVKLAGFDFIQSMALSNTNWTCACGEESPLTFGECWSCGAVREGGLSEEALDAQVDSPTLDKALGSNDDPLNSLNL